ncbi:C69 family dipeptidase [Sporolactobacillus spathodeae]|uniref:Dipeptidase n=1 Tax=Sporolactobacillus spathodeae TaxID=1465502 RepID=A0ABS2Q8K3_9BACL|nr:C69 family dipeptidase [Sporolactobacillus spathodeae]MBM7658118.1 dipeptidase [Sporolactobacillus spathodeae]
MKKNSHASCTSFLAGKKATLDGSTMIGRNEDNYVVLAPQRFAVHPHLERDHEETYHSHLNGFTIDLPKVRFRYTSTPDAVDAYDTYEGSGINENNVAMSATESIYANARVLGYDPLNTETGIAEESMNTVVLPYITSARDGVLRLGKIVETHGAAESNGMLFADKDEVWYMEIATGHLWAAQRIPDDCYAVVANQMALQEIDPDDQENFLVAPGLVDFVEKYHLNTGFGTLNFRNIFGTQTEFDHHYNTPRVWYSQKFLTPDVEQSPISNDLPFLRKANRKLGPEDVQFVLSSHYQETPYDPLGNGSKEDRTRFRAVSLNRTQNSHIMQIRPNVPDEIAGIHWVAFGTNVFTPSVPFYTSISKVPESYAVTPEKLTMDSAYWLHRIIAVIAEPHFRMFEKSVNDFKNKVHSLCLANLAKTDAQIEAGEALNSQQLLEAANAQNAAIANEKTLELLQQLTTDSLALSKLSFTMDENL